MGIPHPPQGCVTPESMDSFSAAIYQASTIFTPVTSSSSLKRGLQEVSTPPSHSTNQRPESDSKRQRISQSNIFTPPGSPRIRPQPLRITIPHKEPTKAEQRTLKLRIGYAERWKPKLQRPFPTKSEIRQAYQYKLLRHYTGPFAVAEPNYFKPHIDRSPRVDKLRRAFPFLHTSALSIPANTRSKKNNKNDTSPSPSSAELELIRNKAITKSKAVRRSAWQNFSSREKDRIDRGREAMMASGLPEEELAKEYIREPNKLPGWRKKYTSAFVNQSKWEVDGVLSASV